MSELINSNNPKKHKYNNKNVLRPDQPINYVNRNKLKHQHQHDNKKRDNKPRRHGTSKLRKQVRDIQRLLDNKQDNLNDEIKQQKLQQIDKLKSTIKYVRELKKLHRYKKRYKMIKFHDWRKLDRKKKQLLKQLKTIQIDHSNNDNVDKMADEEYNIRQQIKQIDRDILYTQNYPPNIRYISLFKIDQNDNEMKQKIDNIRKIIDDNIKHNNQSNKNIRYDKYGKIITIESQLNIPRQLVSKQHIPNEDYDNMKYKDKKNILNKLPENHSNLFVNDSSSSSDDSSDDSDNDIDTDGNSSNNDNDQQQDNLFIDSNSDNDSKDSEKHNHKHKKHKK